MLCLLKLCSNKTDKKGNRGRQQKRPRTAIDHVHHAGRAAAARINLHHKIILLIAYRRKEGDTMTDNDYKGNDGILGSRILNDAKIDVFDNGEYLFTLEHEKGADYLQFNVSNREGHDNTQLKFDFQDGGTLSVVDEDLTIDYMTGNPDYDGTTPVWIYADPVIFDDETKALFLTLPAGERPRFTADLLERFYSARPEYNVFARRTIYDQPAELLNLFKSLTADDFAALEIGNAEVRFNQLQERIKKAETAIEKTPMDPAKVTTIWPVLSIREMFLESEIAAFYYLKNPRISSRELAKENGAIMTTGGRLRDVSNKDYSGWLDEIPNGSAYISYVGPHYWDNIEMDEGGNIYTDDDAIVQRALRDRDKKIVREFANGTFGKDRPEEHERINKEVLRALLNAIIDERDGIKTIYLPTFAAELNENYKIDVDEYDVAGVGKVELNEKGQQNKRDAEQRAEAASTARNKGDKVYTKEKPSIMQQFYSLDYWAGVLDSNDVTRTAAIVGINAKAKTIDVVLPYLEKIRRRVLEAQELEALEHHRQYFIPAYNDHFYSKVDSERDKVALDLAYTIADKLLQRGSKPVSEFKENQADGDQTKENASGTKTENKLITYRIKYSTLIKDTPLLDLAYRKAKTSGEKYDVLRRRFSRAFRILKTKSDLYDYFVDLNIPDIPPTIRTLNNDFVITHRGRNPKYKRKK